MFETASVYVTVSPACPVALSAVRVSLTRGVTTVALAEAEADPPVYENEAALVRTVPWVLLATLSATTRYWIVSVSITELFRSLLVMSPRLKVADEPLAPTTTPPRTVAQLPRDDVSAADDGVIELTPTIARPAGSVSTSNADGVTPSGIVAVTSYVAISPIARLLPAVNPWFVAVSAFARPMPAEVAEALAVSGVVRKSGPPSEDEKAVRLAVLVIVWRGVIVPAA